ncbi:transposase [Bradyrhizobium sp. UFLA01-814]|uniref:transposase n=1 Tax=Bradyrhizobium sp. UFLA01-814 TaxID=3023480 RepID=UPI00398A86A4
MPDQFGCEYAPSKRRSSKRLLATVVNASAFKSSRDLAAWIGLAPSRMGAEEKWHRPASRGRDRPHRRREVPCIG